MSASILLAAGWGGEVVFHVFVHWLFPSDSSLLALIHALKSLKTSFAASISMSESSLEICSTTALNSLHMLPVNSP